jgi:hypothetical protein
MQLLRLDHDAQWELLPVHELREHERLQLNGSCRDESLTRPNGASSVAILGGHGFSHAETRTTPRRL